MSKPLTSSEIELLKSVPQALESGVELLDWWRETDAADSYEKTYKETFVANRPGDTSFGFFGTAPLSSGPIRINGNVQRMFYDEPKAPPVERDGVSAEWMSEAPDTFAPDVTIAEGVAWLLETGYRHLPVMADGELLGVVTTLTGASSLSLDVKRAEQIASTLVPFLHLPARTAQTRSSSTMAKEPAVRRAALVIDASTEDVWAEASRFAPDGFDLILDANGAATLRQSYRHLAAGGKLVVYGFHTMFTKGRGRPSWPKLILDSLRTPRFSPLRMTMDNRSVLAFNLSSMTEHSDLLRRAVDELLGWAAKGRIRPLPTTTYPFDDVARAHADLESGQTTGKLVLVT